MPVVDLSKPIGDPDRVREFTQGELDAIDSQRNSAPYVAPQPKVVASALITVTVVAGVATITGFSATGFGSASRVGVGRIRVFFDPPQPDRDYCPVVAPIHNADVSARVNAPASDAAAKSYVEIKTNASIEAGSYAVQVTRNA